MNRVCANLNVLAQFNDRYAWSGDHLRSAIRLMQESDNIDIDSEKLKPLINQIISSGKDLPEVKLLIADKEFLDTYHCFQSKDAPIEKGDGILSVKKDFKEYILIVYWSLQKLGKLLLQWPCYPIYKWVSDEIDKLHQEFVDDIIASAPSTKQTHSVQA